MEIAANICWIPVCARHGTKQFISLTLFNPYMNLQNVIIPILVRRKPKPRRLVTVSSGTQTFLLATTLLQAI